MLKRVLLSLRRWFVLRKIPREANTHSFLYFDYYVPLGDAHDTIIIYQSGTVTMLMFKQTEALGNTSVERAAEISASQKHELFRWLRERLFNQTSLWKVAFCKDPVKLEVFCKDRENAWRCSIAIFGLQCVEELRLFRGDFIEKVNLTTVITSSSE